MKEIEILIKKKVRVIRKSNKFRYIGILSSMNDSGVLITDRIIGPVFLNFDDILLIEKFRENEQR